VLTSYSEADGVVTVIVRIDGQEALARATDGP
jgi:hypothetical protein